MFRSLFLLSGITVACLSLALTCVAADETRNPFDVKDVPNPDGEDVQAFAKQQKLAGDKKDSNAPQWAEKATTGKQGVLDGEWSSRWGGGTAGDDWISGTATVRTLGDRVYILYKDRTNTYLIDTVKKGKTLIGRYMNIGSNGDSTPWVGLIVDDERIDGIWTQGRWDLRRQLVQSSTDVPDDTANESVEQQVKALRLQLRKVEERVVALEGRGQAEGYRPERSVKLLGMTVMNPTDELIKKYDLPGEVHRGPVIVQQVQYTPYWQSAPGEGCAFWLLENPAHAFFFNEERSPSHSPKTVEELMKAIVACTATPEEYEKIWDVTRQRCRQHAQKVKDKPEERERLLKAAEAQMPKEDMGKYICRVVYHYPKKAGTMTTYIRMAKEDLDQLRELAESPTSTATADQLQQPNK